MNKFEPPFKRRRTKQLIKNIKEQVEFYFSDANLNRDKYLMNLVGQNGENYVPLDVLMSFNQLKELGATVKLIQKSLTDSELLQLNTDMTSVKRKNNFIKPLPSNLDHHTVVIERLPTNTSINWLKEVCSKFGPVSYISLPRFKSDGIKGLAFVEFSNSVDAVLACSVLNAPPRNFFPKLKSLVPRIEPKFIIDPSKDIPSELQNDFKEPAVKRRRTTENASNCVTNDLHLQNSDNSDKKTLLKNSCYKNALFKLPVPIDPIEVLLPPPPNGKKTLLPSKRSMTYEQRLNNPTDLNEDEHELNSPHFATPTVKSKVTCVSNRKIKRHSDVSVNDYSNSEGYTNKKTKEFAEVEENNAKHTAMHKVKKKQRRKQRNAQKGKSNKESNKKIKLRAIMKTEWAELKNSYLHTQRENFGKLKSVLQKCSSPDPETTSVYIKHHLALKKSAAENYLDISESEIDEQENDSMETEKTKHSTCGFVPGVVASLTSLNVKDKTDKLSPLPHFKVIKSYFSQYGAVAYVDVKPGSTDGYIRFESSDAAQRAIMEEKKYGLFLLTSGQEERYWDSLLVSRQLKRSRERRRLRGKQKLILRAESRTDVASKRHIKFNFNFQ